MKLLNSEIQNCFGLFISNLLFDACYFEFKLLFHSRILEQFLEEGLSEKPSENRILGHRAQRSDTPNNQSLFTLLNLI